MGALLLLIFSSFLQADTACSGLFLKEDIAIKAEQSFERYFEHRPEKTTTDNVKAPKYLRFSHLLKKSEHPYSLYKNGLVQLVYLYLYTKSEKDSMEYLNRIDEALGEYQNLTGNIYKQYLNYEVKRQQLEVVKRAVKNNSNLNIYLPKMDSNLQVSLQLKNYPDKETL